ncbi:MAG: hypothetical protein ACXVA7_22310 [Isosphaeraceae bacterium]
MLRRSIRLATILVAVVTIASATFVLAAVAASAGKAKSTTTVSIASTGKLGTSPFGPGATVSITYSCFPNGSGGGKGGYPGGFGSVSIGDLQGHQGFANFPPTCNDTKQTTLVFVPGFFVAGDAAASVFVCGFDCNGTSREIRLR